MHAIPLLSSQLVPSHRYSRALGTLDASGAARGVGPPGAASSSHHHFVAFRSPQQLRAFNAPFQLGRYVDEEGGAAPELDDRFETPSDAALVRVPIRPGDVIVLATDGLFDNMPEPDVLSILDEHAHADEDEMFLVVDGELELQLRDRVVTLHPGEFFIVPRGVEHRPVAKELVSIVLFEPATVRNTGGAVDERTIEPEDLERI